MFKRIVFLLIISVLFLTLVSIVPVQAQDDGAAQVSEGFNYENDTHSVEDLSFRDYGNRTSLEILSDIIADDSNDYGYTYGIEHPFPWAETSLYSSSINFRETDGRYWDLLYTYLEYYDLNEDACIREEFFAEGSDAPGAVYSNVQQDLYNLSSQNFDEYDEENLKDALPLEVNPDGQIRVPTELIYNQQGSIDVIIEETSVSDSSELSEIALSRGYINTDLETATKVLFYGLDEERLNQHMYLHYRLGFEDKKFMMDSIGEKYYSTQHFENVDAWNQETKQSFINLQEDYVIEYQVFEGFFDGFFGDDEDEENGTDFERECHTQVNSDFEEDGGWFDDFFTTVESEVERDEVSFHGEGSVRTRAYGQGISDLDREDIDEFDGYHFTNGDMGLYPGIAQDREDAGAEDIRDAHVTTVNLDNSTRVGHYAEDKDSPSKGLSKGDGYLPPLRIGEHTDFNAYVDWTVPQIHPKDPYSYGSCPTGTELIFTNYQGSEAIKHELIAVHDEGEDVIQIENSTSHGLFNFTNIGENVTNVTGGDFEGLPEGTEELRVESTIEAHWTYIIQDWNPVEETCEVVESGIYYEFSTPKDTVNVDVERMPDDSELEENKTMNVSLDLMIDAYPEGTFYKIDIEPGEYDDYGYWSYLDSEGLPDDMILSRGPWGLTTSRITDWDTTYVSFSKGQQGTRATIVEDLNRIAPVENYAFPDIRNYKSRQSDIAHQGSFERNSTVTTELENYYCEDLYFFDNCAWNFRYTYDLDSYIFESIENDLTPDSEETVGISGYTNQDITEEEGLTLHRLVDGNSYQVEPEEYRQQQELHINVTNVTDIGGMWKVNFRLEDNNGNLKGNMNIDRPGESLTVSGSHGAADELITSYEGNNPYTIYLEEGNWDTSLYMELNYDVDIGAVIQEDDIDEIYYVYDERYYHMGSLLPQLQTIVAIIIVWFILEKAYTYLLISSGFSKRKARNKKLIPVFKYIQVPKPAVKWRKALDYIKMISITRWVTAAKGGKGKIKGRDKVKVNERCKFEITTKKDGKGRKYKWAIQTNPSRPTATKDTREVEHIWEEPGTYKVSAVMYKGAKEIRASKKVQVLPEDSE